MKRLVFVFAFLASCSSEPVTIIKPDPSGGSSSGAGGSQGAGGGLLCDLCESTDGSRIVRQKSIITSEDGLVHVTVAGYFDLQRNEPCAAFLAEDGTRRCLPHTAPTALHFSDASCTVPLMSFSGCSAPPKTALVAHFPQDSCKKPYYVAYSVGAEYVGQAYALQVGLCNPVAGSSKFYSLTKLPPSDFAPMTIEAKP